MPHEDQKYIEALLNNDTTLLEELYRKYSGKIVKLVLRNNGTENDAADIIQEALLSIYHKTKTQNFVLTCPFDAFFHMVCRNRWLNELSRRKSSRVTIKDTDGYNNLGEDSFKLAEQFQLHELRKELIEEKLLQLGESCRQLIRLSWSGKSMEEVAALLKVTYGYARKKKSECVAKLMALIRQSPDFNSLKW